MFCNDSFYKYNRPAPPSRRPLLFCSQGCRRAHTLPVAEGCAMQSLKRSHKEKVRSLCSFTGISESRAIDLLTAVGWQLDSARQSNVIHVSGID